jgi:dihydroorotase
MKYLIKDCKIIDKQSKLNGKRVDILIEKGKISDIRKGIKDEKAKSIKGKNLCASVGWMDIGTHLGEPGYEHRETFESLANAALSGGYTDLATMPQSLPAIQSKAQIKNLISAGKSNGIDIHPLGALSNDLKGENITEFVDMHHGGAVGFTDGLKTVEKGGLLLRALQYVKSFDGVILHHPNDKSLSNEDLIHEGAVSTSMGMKGSPSLAEELTVYRDVQLNSYAESKLCIHLVSTSEAVTIIKSQKKKDPKITAGVSYLNLIKIDEDLATFDTNLKVKPLLRTAKDKRSLQKGLADDTLDYISSNHMPLETEKKHLEFPYATHGAIGLETAFAALNSFTTKNLELATLIDKLTTGPRNVLNIDTPTIEVGEMAKLTIFDPSATWTYEQSDVMSTSRNSPFIGYTFTGKVIATINKDKVYLNP